ncbi:MAG: cell division protein FtsQ [Flavobacterium sp.]|nr:MAG: cell division protein FtsQ [Flavobacterium sp.]
MLKRINWKAIFKVFSWAVCLAGIVVLMSFISIKKKEVKCTKIEILIPGADNFIERDEIDAILRQGEGQLIGRSLANINMHQIENTIKANPYIAFVKVYADMDGVVSIEIKQRQPVLRILNAGGQDYYVDSKGLKMPMSPNFTANVLVATGNILEGFSGRVDTLLTPLAKDLYKTALYAKMDTLWDAQFEQIYVNDKKDMELVPRVGNQRIIIGNADNLETKLSNLLAFYKQAMPMVGWNAYRTINLKYINQIVCEKADSTLVKKPKPVFLPDSNEVIRKSVDSTIKSVIADEIKRATAEANTKPVVQKEKPKEPKVATKDSKTEKSATPAKDKAKTASSTKEKTDTKKNK